jgi:MFS family permease
MYLFTSNPLAVTLRSLRDNTRAIVITEPLWGIPYNLYAPFISVYMVALGLTDAQIGLLASISLGLQVIWTLISGALTDKFGRKRTTFIADIIAWSIPCFIWAIAQDFNYFLLATIINSTWRITHNSWLCLLVESTEPAQLVDVYSMIYIAGLMAAFFSPISALLVASFSLVPTVRGLYFLAFILMTAKFFIMNAMVTEPEVGRARMQATQNQSILTILMESHGVLRQLLRSPETLITGGLMVIVGIATTVNTTFWSVMVTEKLQIPAAYLSLFYVVRSITMLLFFMYIMPKLRTVDVRRPMVFGFGGLILSWLILITIPPQSYGWLVLVVILEGLSFPATNTLLDKLVAISVDPAERARIMALLYFGVILLTSPFGWIAGQISEIDRSLPFVLNIALFSIGALLAFVAARRALHGQAAQPLDA